MKSRRTANRNRMVGLGLVVALFCPIATAQAAEWGFTLYKQNTAMDPSSGATIRVTGAGLFDDGTEMVSAHGAYAISNAADQVIDRGTWVAAEFVDFAPQGGLNPGAQGGVLEITITLVPHQGSAITGVPMTVICPFDPVTGFDEANDATLVGPFSEKIGDGDNVFRLIRP